MWMTGPARAMAAWVRRAQGLRGVVGRVAGQEVERDLGLGPGPAGGDGVPELVQQREAGDRQRQPDAELVAVDDDDQHHEQQEARPHVDREAEHADRQRSYELVIRVFRRGLPCRTLGWRQTLGWRWCDSERCNGRVPRLRARGRLNPPLVRWPRHPFAAPSEPAPPALRLRLRSQAPPPADGDEGPARRQGRQPRRDDERAQAAGAAGLHDLHRRLPGLHGRRLAGRARRRDRQARRPLGAQDGSPPRRPDRPAARQRALGRQVLDAGDDGHRPQPRAQRQEREGPRRGHRRRTLRLRLLPPVHRDVRAHRARHRRRTLRAPARGRQGKPPASRNDAELSGRRR